MPVSKKTLACREALKKARDAIQQRANLNALAVENARLLEENQELNEELVAANHHVAFLQDQISLLRQAGQRQQEELERADQQNANATREFNEYKANCNAMLNETFDRNVRVIMRQHEVEKTELLNTISSLKKQMPTMATWKKPYERIGTQSKNARCATIIKVIEQFVGESNVDDFVTYFVHYVSEKSSFSFSLGLSAFDSYLLCARWKISSETIDGVKHFLKKKLGFGVLSAGVPDMRRLYSTRALYNIRLVHETTKSVIVELIDLRAMLVKRLEFMDMNARLRLADDEPIIVKYLYGKGEAGEVTMMVAVVENSVESDKSHGFTLLGYYTGDDDEETLDENLGAVREQAAALDSITYNGKTRAVLSKFGTLDNSHIDDFQSVFHTLKTRNHAAFRDSKLKAEAICQQMYNFNVMFDSENLGNLCE